MRLLYVLIIALLINGSIQGQDTKPKLVVGIIVDQMRQDYILRFGPRFGEGGFNRFIKEGYQFKNTHYNYIPTKTAPGHASVYTGTTPFVHGIVANDWYSYEEGKEIYCAEDHTYKSVGSDTEKGQMSPKNLKASTITDELRLSSQFRSNVISLSIKDRGAIMPAGNSGMAIWMDKTVGKFVTSTYYADKLPDWVAAFNKQKQADKFMKSTWTTLYDIKTYTASGEDKEPSEKTLDGRMSGFPYDLSKLDNDYENIIKTPFGNEILTNLVLEALEHEELGDDDITDFLAISYSATDYIGHDNGPYSIEVEDTYLRLDADLAKIFSKLDAKLGKGNYTVFLTADHAVASIPQYLMDRKFNSGYLNKKDIFPRLKMELNDKFGQGDWISHEVNYNIYLNHDFIAKTNFSISDVSIFVRDFLNKEKGITEAYTSQEIRNFSHADDGLKGMLGRGFNVKRSGDVVYLLDPSWILGYSEDATGHGSGYTFDTHVPLLWYGNGIKPGHSFKYHTITQIAPTLSMMLEITLPNGAMCEPLYELLDK